MREKRMFDSDIYRRSKEAIAHGALTNSKRPESFIKGVYPTHLTHGHGAYVWDTKKNRYIDFVCGLGSNLLGYAQEEITDAITRQARYGITLSLGTTLEVEAAERVKGFFPFIERLRFLKTGSDACSAAITIARAFTGRREILSEGYHGWHSEFVSLTPPASGVVSTGFIDSLKSLEQISQPSLYPPAAVIVEPVITDFSPGRIAWLKALREECTKARALLIFDEVITGLRVREYSIAEQYGVIPDLICLGKALGGGLPLSIVGGREDVMEREYFVSSTFAGETLSLAAAIKTMDLLNSKFRIGVLWDKGELFLKKFNEAAIGIVQLEGYATRSKFVGDDLKKGLFFQEACRAGILFGPSLFFSFPHIELMDEVLSIVSDVVGKISRGEVAMEGELPLKPYAERVRGNVQ